MATAQPNFGSILDRKPTAIERPKVLPVGSYIAVVQGMPRQDKSTKKQTPYYEYTCKYLQAMDDVDPDDLSAALTRADGTKKTLGDMTQKLTYYITEDAIWRLKQFLEHCGLDEDDFESTRQMAESAGGCQVVIKLRHKPSEDGESMYPDVAGTAPVN